TRPGRAFRLRWQRKLSSVPTVRRKHLAGNNLHKATRKLPAPRESVAGKALVAFRFRGMKSHQGKIMKALPILFDVYEPEKITKKQALVGAGDQTEQRLRFGTESFQIEEPTKNRALAKTLGGTQQTTQGQTVPTRDAHVDV